MTAGKRREPAADGGASPLCPHQRGHTPAREDATGLAREVSRLRSKSTKRASPATETARAARLFGVRRQSPPQGGRRRRLCCMRAACANLRSRGHARAAEEKRRQAAALQNASPRPVRRKPNARNASSRWRAVQRAYATSFFSPRFRKSKALTIHCARQWHLWPSCGFSAGPAALAQRHWGQAPCWRGKLDRNVTFTRLGDD